MAASGLDHLKNDYRRRFCRPSRIPDINVEQGQDILEILQDCFEEESLANDFSTESVKSGPYSKLEIKDTYVQSSNKEAHCQKSHPQPLQVSSGQTERCLQLTLETNEDDGSAQSDIASQEILAIDIDSENTSDLENVANEKENIHHKNKADEFYLSVCSSSLLDTKNKKRSVSENAIPSITQKGETYTFENSVNMQSPNTEISYKTKKRLNFEDKDVLTEVEIEHNISEGPPEKSRSAAFQKRTQKSEVEIHQQAKKSFSTLFIESVHRKNESRHVTSTPLHTSSPNDVKLLEDEFIIDDSKTNFPPPSWITIPRKAKPPTQCAVTPVERTRGLQGREAREKHHSVTSETLTSDTHSQETHPVEKSQASQGKKVGKYFALTDKLKNSPKSTKDKVYSENTEKSTENRETSSGNKRRITTKQKRKRKIKANAFEEHLDVEKPEDKRRNTSTTAQEKLPKKLGGNVEMCEDVGNGHISEKQITHVGKMENRTQKKSQEKLKKKSFSNGPKKKIIPGEVPLTVTRSQRISRRPSNWWEVASVNSPVSSSPLITNELSVHQDSRQKPAEKIKRPTKNVGKGKETTILKRQKTTTQCNSRAHTVLDVKDSGGVIDDEEISSSLKKSLKSDRADLVEKKDFEHSGTTGSSQDEDSSDSVTTAQKIHIQSHTSGYSWKTKDFEKLQTLVLDAGEPSVHKKYVTSGKSHSEMSRKEAQKSSDIARGKKSNISKNKIHHKLVLPSSTPNVRRTKRIRLKPLEYWRGERVDYEARQSGGFVVGGILSPDLIPPKGKRTNGNIGKVNKIHNRKRICLDNNEGMNKLVANMNMPLGDLLQPTRVKDPETKEIVLMDLIRPRDTCEFFVEHEELKVYKILDTPFFATGKLVLGPCQEKGKQHVGVDTLIFFVDFGNLLCTLHETPYLITTGDSFYVPSGNHYNIRNLLNEESVLLFTQIKG